MKQLLSAATILAAFLPLLQAAKNKVIIDWNDAKPPPKDCVVTGYAFGTHYPSDTERLKAARTTPNQRQYQSGTLTTPEFLVEHDFMQVACAGTYHPRLCTVSLIVDDKAVRSVSPGMHHDGGGYCFDTKALKGMKAKLKLHDGHFNGWIQSVRATATDVEPGRTRLIDGVPNWEQDSFEQTSIEGNYLIMPVGHEAPIQEIEVEIDGKKKLSVDLPLAFGDMKIIGYTPIYDLTGYQGKSLKISYHSFTGSQQAQLLVQNEVPDRKKSDHFPGFHPHCRLGRLNDPNGLCYANGTWHLFYQYYLGVRAKTWAHYTSPDLVHWQEKPTGLFHDHLGSMHSGSAAVDVMNTSGWQIGDTLPIIAAFTGSRGMGGHDKIQVQGIAYSTDSGKTFTKYEGNPVVGKDQNLKSAPKDQRDPKIFWYSPTKGRDATAKDGYWVMILYEGRNDKYHAIFTSTDLKHWTRHGKVTGFYECPELFPLAVDRDPNNVKWVMYGADGNYHIGSFDGKSYSPETRSKIRMNWGSRYYAAQTFNNTPRGPDGQERRIQVGWQDRQISTPVELTLRSTPLGLRVCLLPVEELANLRTSTLTLDGLTLAQGAANPVAGYESGLYDIELVANVSRLKGMEFTIRGGTLTFDAGRSKLTFGRAKITLPKSDKLNLRIVVDNWSTDIYAGEHGLYHIPYSISSRQKGLSLSVTGGGVLFEKLRVHDLKSIWYGVLPK